MKDKQKNQVAQSYNSHTSMTDQHVLYAVADIIGFRYKGGRYVKGQLIRIDDRGILLLLHTDYIGRNVEWYEGEDKYFNKNEMKKVTKL